jgi:ABC-type antimicrobial peptide transport system permease subunit
MLDGVATEVVGVMPKGFSYPAGRALWTPLEYNENFTSKQRSAWYLTAIGRARPGVSLDQVSSEVALIGKQLAAKYPDSNQGLDFAAVERSISQPRFYMTLLTIFASLALVLAAIGTFGVLSYAVAQRSREIGIRMALGAQERTVIGLIVRHAMILAAGGVTVGVTAAWFLSKLLATFLFATDPRDLGTFAPVSLTLGLVAMLASYPPARRATKIDPVVALRSE